MSSCFFSYVPYHSITPSLSLHNLTLQTVTLLPCFAHSYTLTLHTHTHTLTLVFILCMPSRICTCNLAPSLCTPSTLHSSSSVPPHALHPSYSHSACHHMYPCILTLHVLTLPSSLCTSSPSCSHSACPHVHVPLHPHSTHPQHPHPLHTSFCTPHLIYTHSASCHRLS